MNSSELRQDKVQWCIKLAPEVILMLTHPNFIELEVRLGLAMLTTHFLFYKNTVYKIAKPQLWGYLKNICIAEIADLAKVVYF